MILEFSLRGFLGLEPGGLAAWAWDDPGRVAEPVRRGLVSQGARQPPTCPLRGATHFHKEAEAVKNKQLIKSPVTKH